MSQYRVEFTSRASSQTVGLPTSAYLAMNRGLGKLLDDPWDSDPTDERADVRRITFASLGLVTVRIDEPNEIVWVLDVLWVG